ncbi:MAG: hypothetical protein RI925_1673 [Pseudomonadota bacterium]|jgi:hypothetical protein
MAGLNLPLTGVGQHHLHRQHITARHQPLPVKLAHIALMHAQAGHQLVGHHLRGAAAQHVQIRLGHRQLEVLPRPVFSRFGSVHPGFSGADAGRNLAAGKHRQRYRGIGRPAPIIRHRLGQRAGQPGNRLRRQQAGQPAGQPGQVGLHLGHFLVMRPHRAQAERGPAGGLGALDQMAAGFGIGLAGLPGRISRQRHRPGPFQRFRLNRATEQGEGP